MSHYPQRRSALGKQRLDETFGFETLEVVDVLADADILDRDAEFFLDGDDDAALRGAVELREDDSGQIHRLLEDARLLQTVLPGNSVEDEEGLVRRSGLLARDHTADFLQLLDQMDFIVKPPSCIDHDHV